MGDKKNLLDIDYKNFSKEEKRVGLVLMDTMLKKLHEKNYVVTSFAPMYIYYNDGFFTFDKIEKLEYSKFDNKEEAILDNLVGLSTLAFCIYLDDYNLKRGLLNTDVINNNYKNFSTIFPEEDRDYYKKILVDAYETKVLPKDLKYYSDYIISKEKKSSSTFKTGSKVFIKATEAGKAFSSQEEAAFGHKFFILTVVASMTVLLTGFLIYLSNYIG